jgi:hypothetical protein
MVRTGLWQPGAPLLESDGGGGGGGDGAPAKTVTFTQEALDALFAERARQAERAALQRIQQELGAEPAAVKAQLEELAKLKAASASEQEKLLAEARRAEREAAEAEWRARVEQAEQRRKQALRTAEIKAAATGRFHDVGDVLMALASDETITVGDDDRVSGVAEALDRLAQAKPHWVKPAEPARPPVHLGAPAGGRSSSGDNGAAAERVREDHARLIRSMF